MTRRGSGLRSWFLQRVSAVYLGVFLLYALIHIISQTPLDYIQWRDWVGGSAVSIAFGLFFASLLIHAWVGLRDIIMDYFGSLTARLLMLTLVGLVLFACGLWAGKILISAVTV